MKGKTALRVTVVVLLLLGSVAFRPSREVVQAQAGGPARLSTYTAGEATSSGGGYYLTALTWRMRGVASGGRYRLLVPGTLAEGSGCCCTYVPCVLRRVP